MLFDDPVFGLIAFGGEVTAQGKRIAVIPRDGVRQRCSALLDGRRLHIELDRDGFAAGQPLRISRDFRSLAFVLENRAAQPHATHLQFTGLPAGRYTLKTPQATREVTAIPGGQLTGTVNWGVTPNETVELRIKP